MTSDNVLKKTVAVEATDVANKFVKIYYTTIRRDPKKTHQFYMDDSKFTRIEDGKDPNIVSGQQNIYKVLETISYEKIIVDHVDSQGAPNGGVLIVVTGRLHLSGKGAEPEDFVQTFVLGQRGSQLGKTRQFYVCNDILRYLPRPPQKAASISGKVEDTSSFKKTEETQKTDSIIMESKEKEAKTIDKKEVPPPEVEVKTQAETAVETVVVEKPTPKPSTEQPPIEEEKPVEDATPVKPISEPSGPSSDSKEASKGDSPEEQTIQPPAPTATKKVKNPKRNRKDGNASKWESKKGGEKENKPVMKDTPVKAGPKSWAMRMRDSQARSQTAPAIANATPSPTTATTPAAVAPAKPVVDKAADVEVKSTRGGRNGKKAGRGGKSGKSSFNFNDPENIALTLYVSNLPDGVEKVDIERKFAEFGTIREIQIPHPDHKYCFVHYSEKESVEAAIKARPVKLNGEELKVDKRRPSNRNKSSEHGRGRGRGRGRHYRGRGDNSKRMDGGVKRGKRGRDSRVVGS
ncbi:hypothetical protein AAMO2058_001232100 [Amorphochlora amoebiformis]|mmetsp:Transcript_288/g.405  ORF Transcript_288/g.405 Transcript_288/m.405 type:complete len:518 (-) Transcript_288:190-1743(-)